MNSSKKHAENDITCVFQDKTLNLYYVFIIES